MKLDHAISQDQIDAWKAEYGKLYKSTIGDFAFIWRKLRRKEYVDIMSQEKTADVQGDKVFARQALIVKAVTLYPDNLDELLEENAGLATSISDEIIIKSGFVINDTEEI